LFSTASWSSDLLKSSKLIGRSGQTLREQLRQAMLEQKAGITPSDETVPLIVEKEIEELPPMPEIVYSTETSTKNEPVVGSALKQGPGLPLVKRKRKKKQVKIKYS
jgi:ATP-dependent RNA helicase DHX37/DHR1